MLLLQQLKSFRLVEQREQSRRRDERRRLDRFRRRLIFKIERQNRRVAFNHFKYVSALVPSNVRIRRRLARQRADGHERRAFGVRELELPWRLPVSGHAHGINRRDWAGEADGGNAIRRDGHGDDGAFVEGDALNGFGRFSKCDGRGQQDEETNW